MRRLLTGVVVAAVFAVIPMLAFAGNQEIAEQIAGKLRRSNRMSDYKVSVKYQNGTAWLRGRVTSDEQMEAALRLTFQVPEVARVVNELSVVSSDEAQAGHSTTSANPLRSSSGQKTQRRSLAQRLETVLSGSDAHADRVPSSDSSSMVEPTAGEEPQELPPPSQYTRSPGRTSRAPTRVAMQEPIVRGPVAPGGAPMPMYHQGMAQAGTAPARYDQPCLPNYAWPSYAAYPNYAAVTYPKQYSPTAWPYIGPFYPYPQVPLGWRQVKLEWDDGWWFLDFKDQPASCGHR
jgi:hypothetical protein